MMRDRLGESEWERERLVRERKIGEKMKVVLPSLWDLRNYLVNVDGNKVEGLFVKSIKFKGLFL